MNLNSILNENKILCELLAGSHLYGTNIETSDKDIRGIFKVSKDAFISLITPPEEVSDSQQDIKYYELRKILNLASTANPNIIELLFIPNEAIIKTSKEYDILRENAPLFITKKCYHSYTGYAYAQLKKAKGQNKKVHFVDNYINERGYNLLKNMLCMGMISKDWVESRFSKNFYTWLIKKKDVFEPIIENPDFNKMDKYLSAESIQTLRRPRREDFCYLIDHIDDMPFRSSKIGHIELNYYDCSSINHVSNLYRLYKNGSGVFKNNQMVFTSISKERELTDFVSLFSFNENEYEKAVSDWESFFEWMALKNDNRWVDFSNKEFDYDRKNMMHLMRLMMEAKNIVNEGKPKVRFYSDERQYLLNVRNGVYKYEQLTENLEKDIEELKTQFDKSSLPHGVNMKKVNELYKELMEM